MTQEQLKEKLEAVKAKWEAQLGVITDIWISLEYMEILDSRSPFDRIEHPYKLGETFVTIFQPLAPNQLRIAFLTECNLEEDINESTSVDGSASGGGQASGEAG